MFSIKYNIMQVLSIHKRHDNHQLPMMYEGCHHLDDVGVLNLPGVTK